MRFWGFFLITWHLSILFAQEFVWPAGGISITALSWKLKKAWMWCLRFPNSCGTYTDCINNTQIGPTSRKTLNRAMPSSWCRDTVLKSFSQGQFLYRRASDGNDRSKQGAPAGYGVMRFHDGNVHRCIWMICLSWERAHMHVAVWCLNFVR